MRRLSNNWRMVMADASICGLGQAAPNPVLSLLRDFRSELASSNLIAKG